MLDLKEFVRMCANAPGSNMHVVPAGLLVAPPPALPTAHRALIHSSYHASLLHPSPHPWLGSSREGQRHAPQVDALGHSLLGCYHESGNQDAWTARCFWYKQVLMGLLSSMSVCAENSCQAVVWTGLGDAHEQAELPPWPALALGHPWHPDFAICCFLLTLH